MTDTIDDVPLPGMEDLAPPPDYSVVKVKHPTGRVWKKLMRDIERILDQCGHDERDDKIDEHITATPEFFTEGVNYGSGISVTTCEVCRPMVERLIDNQYGRHYDRPRRRG